MKIVTSGATHSPETSGLAWDSNPGTRWTSGTAMEPTMAYWVTLDAPAMISGINATTPEPNDNPRSWVVAVMDSDGGHGRKEVASGAGVVSATFAPVRGQVVRIECTSADPFYWWSISDLTIDATDIPPIVGPPPAVEPPPDLDVLVGPMALDEPAARYLVEALAKMWGWPIRQRDGVDFTTGAVTVEQSVVYVVARARAQGILEPWPFT